MKILGEKSLSSKVIVGLKALFVAISVLDVVVLTLTMKTIRNIVHNENLQSNIFDLNLFVMLILSGIIALLIIYQFIKIFQNIKSNILFSKEFKPFKRNWQQQSYNKYSIWNYINTSILFND